MLLTFQRYVVWLIVIAVIGLSGCASKIPAATERDELADLNEAIEALGTDLAQQLGQVGKSLLPSKKNVLVDRFVDIQTGQVNSAYRYISEQVPQVIARNLRDFTFRPMVGKENASAAYVLSGSIGLEEYPGKGKQYRIYASVTQLKTGMVIANARVWLRSSKELDLSAEAAYGESPMFLSDRSMNALVTTTKTLPGALADPSYLAQLSTNALLNEAEIAYNKDDVPLALQIFTEAAQRPDGQLMRTYSGLYLAHKKTGNAGEAESAFSQLVSLGLAAQQVSVKFLFRVASTGFIDDPRQSGQYAMWLRQIARQIASKQVCLDVIGHTSRSGADTYNERLSLQRAEAISKVLVQQEPTLQKKLRAVGRGARDNIIGSGTDDNRDAIDRRVEFKIVTCQK